METTEMRMLHRISRKTLLDRERSEVIRRTYQTDNNVDWASK